MSLHFTQEIATGVPRLRSSAARFLDVAADVPSTAISYERQSLTMNRQAIARRGKHLEHFTIALMVVPRIANEGVEGMKGKTWCG